MMLMTYRYAIFNVTKTEFSMQTTNTNDFVHVPIQGNVTTKLRKFDLCQSVEIKGLYAKCDGTMYGTHSTAYHRLACTNQA